MTVKILLPAYGRRGCIVAHDGKLRVVDSPTPICHGFANGCLCGNCSPHARRSSGVIAKKASPCRCDVPIDGDDGDCFQCGKRIELRAA
jgi:hypothetical protein